MVKWENEDFGHVFLDDKYLFVIDYDTYGRAGQSKMIRAIHTIADCFNVKVDVVWEDEDDG